MPERAPAQRSNRVAVGRIEAIGHRRAGRGRPAVEQRGERRVDAHHAPTGVDEHHAGRRGVPGAAQQLVGALAPQSLALELGEDGDLGAQHDGLEGLEHVVHGAGLVAAQHVGHVGADRGQEDDRRARAAFAPADVLRRLEAVHARHLDVEQHDGEILVEQRAQRLLARARRHEPHIERFEHGGQREQVLGPVVDEQDGGRLGLGLWCVAHRSHTRMSDSSVSMSTGLVM